MLFCFLKSLHQGVLNLGAEFILSAGKRPLSRLQLLLKSVKPNPRLQRKCPEFIQEQPGALDIAFYDRMRELGFNASN